MTSRPAAPPTSADEAWRPHVVAIVLAGGRSSRFGRDKLAEPLAGRPLLHHAIGAVAPVAGEIVVVIATAGDPPPLPDPATIGRPVRILRDPEPFGGPLIALSAALDEATAPVALLVAGDMPGLRPAVLAAMVRTLAESGADLVILAGRGPLQTIPAALRVATTRPTARDALASGSRALRALYDRLAVVVLSESEWRLLDPDAATLRDVDTPADLPSEPG